MLWTAFCDCSRRMACSVGVAVSTYTMRLSLALRSDHPQSMRAYVRLVGLPVFWKSWGALEQVVRTASPRERHFDISRDPWKRRSSTRNEVESQSAISPVSQPRFFHSGTLPTLAVASDTCSGDTQRQPKSRGSLRPPHVIERVEADEAIGTSINCKRRLLSRPAAILRRLHIMEVLHDWTMSNRSRSSGKFVTPRQVRPGLLCRDLCCLMKAVGSRQASTSAPSRHQHV